MNVAVQQLDFINIGCASSKSNIRKKNLKQALLRLRMSMTSGKQEHEKLMKTAAEAESVKLKVPKSTLTEVFAFEGSPRSVADAITYDKHSQRRVRQPSGEELQAAPAMLGSY